MIKYSASILLVIIITLTGCDKWYTTRDVSHISPLPEFTIEGGEFISISRSDSDKFIKPVVTAKSGETELRVDTLIGTIDFKNVGVYIILYSARNADGLTATAQLIVAVTDVDVSNNDLSGTYVGTLWDPVESEVKKINPKGLYKCGDVMGYPGAKMTGKFVDLGNNKLVLIAGEGDLGRYKSFEGSYSRSTLSWTISLIDPPNTGIELPVLWRKKE
jgi:hypothetical protein